MQGTTEKVELPVINPEKKVADSNTAVILETLARAAGDSKFLARLAYNSSAALNGYYTLTREQLAALLSQDIEQTIGWVSNLDKKHASWLWFRLSKETDLKSPRDVLLRGLGLLIEYQSLGLNEPPLNLELKKLETEANFLAESLGQIKNKEEAIGQMVQELINVEKILNNYQSDKSSLIQILLDIQSQNHWLPKPTLRWVSERLGVALSRIYHIATFYKAFSLIPKGRHSVVVCLGTACQVRGAPRLLDRVMAILKIKPGETSEDMRFSLDTVNCLGCCALGPVMVVNGEYHGRPSIKEIERIAAGCK